MRRRAVERCQKRVNIHIDRRVWALAPAVLLVTAFAPTALAPFRGGEPTALLPDLYQRAPYDLAVVSSPEPDGIHFRLGFASAVENVGAGPLLIVGHRSSTDEAAMRADQILRLRGGGTRTVPDVGVLRYVVSATHEHWHLERFDRYELRPVGAVSPLLEDRKTGFCLGDRYRVPSVPKIARLPRQTLCGPGEPELLRVVEGLSPGYGDVYPANIEGQYLDVTGLPGGDYVLINRVNGDGALLESHYRNDVASVLIRLSWPDGQQSQPSLTVLDSCEPGRPGQRARCQFRADSITRVWGP
jgi:hypothetical protein